MTGSVSINGTTRQDTRRGISAILNLLTVIFALIGTYIMPDHRGDGTGLSSSGAENLKDFTVLSNELCGITTILWLVFEFLGKKFPILPKLMAASAVGLTFLIVAAFLAPIYSDPSIFKHFTAPCKRL